MESGNVFSRPRMVDNRGKAGQWWIMHRRSIFRYLASFFLWTALIMSLAVSIRTLGLTEGVVAEIKAGAITPRQAEHERAVSEAAQAFVAEWLSFDGDNDDYVRRMAPYGTFAAPSGEQSVDYIGIESMKQVGESWRVVVNVSLTRYITVDTAQSNPPAKSIVRQYSADNRQMVVYRNKLRESYEISIREAGPDLEVIGIPVLLAGNPPKGCKVEKFIGDDDYSGDFDVFVQQVLPMYYRGEDLANYLADGVVIKAVGGYETGNIKIEKYESSGETARALVNVDISDRGTAFKQQLVIEARQVDRRWLLIRLGGY